MLIEKIKKTVGWHGMLSAGDRVVVAVSGGPDSVCLLHVLRELSATLDLTLHIAHLDHGFRGQESALEAEFVRRMASALGIPFSIEHRNVPAHCAERGLSAQEGARQVRYDFVEQVAKDIDAPRIALGHTADDQAETVLMRLIRGAGLSGLSGMPPKRGRFIRPLIGITREQVLAYLTERAIPFVTDPSNEKTVYTRNRVRQEIMPVLRQFNPRIAETLAAEAQMLRDENDAIAALDEQAWDKIVSVSEGQARIERTGFLSLSTALQRRLLRRSFDMLQEQEDGLSSVLTEEAIEFIAAAQTGRSMEFPSGLVLVREYDEVRIGPAERPAEFDISVPAPGRTEVERLGLTMESAVADAPYSTRETANYLWQAVFDYDKITLPLRLRSRRPGDSIRPAGMGGRSKKLQDLFVDEKVPRAQRNRVPLLAAGDDILWVMGVRTDERFLPGPGTKKLLVVTIRKTP